MMPVVLVCDEGPGVGLGHRRRCQAVADALRDVDCEPVIVNSNRGVVAAPVIVVDSYQYRADDRRHFVPDFVVAIDDLDRDLAVDVVVLPAPGATGANYRNAGVVLAGAKYSLLDPRIARAAREQRRTGASSTMLPPRSSRVLVTMGGSDRDGVGQRIAEDCRSRMPGAEIGLVIGAWGDQTLPAGVEGIWAPDGLLQPLLDADVVVTAGGVTLLESVALGRTTVVVETASNQAANIEAIVHEGAAIRATAPHAAEVVAALARDDVRRRELVDAGQHLIDGDGARRIAAAVAERLVVSTVVH